MKKVRHNNERLSEGSDHDSLLSKKSRKSSKHEIIPESTARQRLENEPKSTRTLLNKFWGIAWKQLKDTSEETDRQPLQDSSEQVKSWDELKRDLKAVTTRIDQKWQRVLPHLSAEESYELISQYCELQGQAYKEVSSRLPNRVTRGVNQLTDSALDRNTDENSRIEANKSIQDLQNFSDKLASHLNGANPGLDIALRAPSVYIMEERFHQATSDIDRFILENQEQTNIDKEIYNNAKEAFKKYTESSAVQKTFNVAAEITGLPVKIGPIRRPEK